MTFRSAEFSGAIGRPGQSAPGELPQVAICGRSNVGKSSLVNSLTRRKSLARVSKRPGKTQEINFFEIEGKFYLVDLPGYGFARAPETVRRTWGPLIESYLTENPHLLGVVQLIDARHGPSADDRQLLDFLASLAIPALFVLTKIDKLNRRERRDAIRDARSVLELPEDQLLATSARTGEGTDSLAESIRVLVREARAVERDPRTGGVK